MTTNIELAKEVAKHVSLRSVSLARALVESDMDPYEAPPNLALSQKHRCRFDTKKRKDASVIRVYVDLHFAATSPQGNESSKEIMSLEATFLLCYEVSSKLELKEEQLEQFASVNGPYNVWPYWRELVQTATGRVGLASIVIPVYRPKAVEVDKKLPKEKKKKTE